jgi:chemotaxis family two-component system sensor kinase Cph1
MQSTTSSLSSPDLWSCDAEPIHIPGSIQPHGALLLFDATSETLAHWAGDLERLLGDHPALGRQARALLGSPLHELIGSRLLITGEEAVHVGTVSPAGKEPLAVLVCRTGPFISVELEPAGYAGTIATALERVRLISEQISSMPTLAEAYDSAAAHVREITGYDRVMVYQFLPDKSGSVVAEARAPDVAAYMNHRFPASDIPVQAHELYKRSLIRVIPDVSYPPAPLQPESRDPVDMSQCVLRSVSPAHIQYLKNMEVGASMSISLLVDGELWGLIACHHRTARRVSAEARLLCRHVGASLSACIGCFGHAENASRIALYSTALEDLLKSLRASGDPERALRTSSDQLAALVDCGGFALLANGEMVAGAGNLPSASQLRELAPLIEEKLVGRESFATDRLGELVFSSPDLIAQASGALAVWIEASRPLLAVWLRPEQIEEIAWAGAPHVKDDPTEPLKALTPRSSFATWRQTVQGHSRAWTWHEINVVEQFHRRAELAIQRQRLNQLVQELGEANATLKGLATTDPLTGLPNRRLFDERLRMAWQRALGELKSLAVVAIDIDNFKKYNDRFGHPAGDECLRQVAAAMGSEHRGDDVVARLGGEEFGALLFGTDARGAAVVAERLRLAVEQLGIEHPLNDAGVVTISLGIAAGSPAQWGEPARLLSAADQALYQAKASGRNRACQATPTTLD